MTFGIPYPVFASSGAAHGAGRCAASLAALIGLAAGGDAAAAALHLHIPGALLGTVALALLLLARPRLASRLPGADALIRLLPLLFVPLVVGAVAPLRALGPLLLPAVLTVGAATLAALAAATISTLLLGRLCSRSR